jgi:hypothetical protein
VFINSWVWAPDAGIDLKSDQNQHTNPDIGNDCHAQGQLAANGRPFFESFNHTVWLTFLDGSLIIS